MRRITAPFLLRRMLAARMLLASVMASVAVTTMLTAALATFAAQPLPESAQRLLVSSGTTSISITGNASTSGVAGEQAAVKRSLLAAFGRVRYRLDSAIWSNPLGLPAARGARGLGHALSRPGRGTDHFRRQRSGPGAVIIQTRLARRGGATARALRVGQ